MAGALGRSPVRLVEQDCVTVAPRKAATTAEPRFRRRTVRHPSLAPVDGDIAIGWTSAVAADPRIGEAGARKFVEDAIAHTNEALRGTGIYHVTLHLVWTGPMGRGLAHPQRPRLRRGPGLLRQPTLARCGVPGLVPPVLGAHGRCCSGSRRRRYSQM
jgi:hypothetical protein